MKHIAITKQVIDGNEVNAVSGRELYEKLGFDKSQFARWSKKNIVDNGFATEGRDYIVIDIMSSGKEIKDYIVSIDFGNKLAMMAKTEEGEKLRSYFVKVEKQFKKEIEKSNALALEDAQEKLRNLFLVSEATGEMISDHDRRLNNLEKNTRLEAWQEKALQDAKNKKVYELAKDDKAMANKLHRKVWQLFKNRFHLPRYSELRVGQYEAGLEYIYGLTLSDMVG